MRGCLKEEERGEGVFKGVCWRVCLREHERGCVGVYYGKCRMSPAFVGHTVEEGGCAPRANVEVPPCVEISLSRHVVGKHTGADTHGPQELVDVVRGIAGQTYSCHGT